MLKNNPSLGSLFEYFFKKKITCSGKSKVIKKMKSGSSQIMRKYTNGKGNISQEVASREGNPLGLLGDPGRSGSRYMLKLETCYLKKLKYFHYSQRGKEE